MRRITRRTRRKEEEGGRRRKEDEEEDGIEMDPRESRARARVRGLRVQCLPL